MFILEWEALPPDDLNVFVVVGVCSSAVQAGFWGRCVMRLSSEAPHSSARLLAPWMSSSKGQSEFPSVST